jgi:radical SAM superfamily enzyme YgiQ (UPF0313 family)
VERYWSKEAAQHADSVVIGEAEGVWQELLRDAKNGGLKKFYQCSKRPQLSEMPFPRREVLNGKRYCFLKLVLSEISIHLKQSDFAGSRNYRHRQISFTFLILNVTQVQYDFGRLLFLKHRRQQGLE